MATSSTTPALHRPRRARLQLHLSRARAHRPERHRSQNVTAGQFPTAVVILTPTFSSINYPYPSGTVTLTDEASRTFTANLPGNTDTVFIPITNAPSGTHTYTASFSGSAPYAAIPTFGSYTVTVGPGSLSSTTTSLSGVVSPTTFGSASPRSQPSPARPTPPAPSDSSSTARSTQRLRWSMA